MRKLDFPRMLFSRNCFRWNNRILGVVGLFGYFAVLWWRELWFHLHLLPFLYFPRNSFFIFYFLYITLDRIYRICIFKQKKNYSICIRSDDFICGSTQAFCLDNLPLIHSWKQKCPWRKLNWFGCLAIFVVEIDCVLYKSVIIVESNL